MSEGHAMGNADDSVLVAAERSTVRPCKSRSPKFPSKRDSSSIAPRFPGSPRRSGALRTTEALPLKHYIQGQPFANLTSRPCADYRTPVAEPSGARIYLAFGYACKTA